MANNPALHLSIYLHGDCLVCRKPLDDESGEVALLKKAGDFPRIRPDGTLVMSKTSLIWLHAVHLA